MNTLDNYWQSYRAECETHLESLEQSLLAIEQQAAKIDLDAVNRARRAVHAVKICAGLAGLGKAGELAHQMEIALALIRWSRLTPTPDRITVLLEATDKLSEWIEQPEAEEAGAAEIIQAVATLDGEKRISPATAAGAKRQLRTLLVEDEPTSRLLLQTFLSRYGDVDIAVNGNEAVSCCRTMLGQGRTYDLICLDIMMPEMDGPEALRHVRALEEEHAILPTDGAKVIMTTAVDDLQQVARCFWDLCDAYLVKPIDLAKLLNYMRSYRLVV